MMWEAIWALLEKLIPQIPTRADMDRSFEGLLSKLPRGRQDRPQPVQPLEQIDRQAAQKALAPLERAEQINQQSAAGISRLQQMLDNLGKPKPAEQASEASEGAKHVIVDNAKDLQPDARQEPLKAPEPVKTTDPPAAGRLAGLMQKLESLQSPEWRSLSEAERNRRFQQRFQSDRPDVSRLLQTNTDGQTVFKWQRPPRQPPPTPPVPTGGQPAPRGKRSFGSRLATLWRWKTRPAKMVNFGRKLQMGAGRLMSLGGGNRMVSGAAAGVSRLGMLIEGMGMSRVAGVTAGLAGLALAAPAAVAGVWGLAKSVKAAGDGLLADQKRLAEFSGMQSRAAMITNISQIQTDRAAARDTGPATVELAKEMAKFRQAMQPLESTAKGIEIQVTTWGARFGAAAADSLRELMAMPVEMWKLGKIGVENPIAWLLGGNDALKQLREWREREKKDAQKAAQQIPILPAQEFLQALRQAMGQPGGQRRPLDPL